MPEAKIVCGLGFGDEGKGAVVDRLVRRSTQPLVVRYGGGPQCGHNVFTSDGKCHTFAQFGSGALAGAPTFLSEHMLVNPLHLLAEEAALYAQGVNPKLAISGGCVLITPWHKALNKIREEAREFRHGSCGQGIGETMRERFEYPEYTIKLVNSPGARVSQLRDHLWQQAAAIDPHSWHMSVFESDDILEGFIAAHRAVRDEYMVYESWLKNQWQTHDLIFEGHQGVLLDEWHGFHPYTTWSTTTFDNALDLLRDYPCDVTRLGILRSYSTRHGAGPFVAEDPHFTQPELVNGINEWQGSWRTGPFDMVMARYALSVVGRVDGLVMTHCDRIRSPWPVVQHYVKPDGMPLVRLPVYEDHDLVRQEGLTELLFKCKPFVQEYGGNGIKSMFPMVIAEELGVKLHSTIDSPSA